MSFAHIVNICFVTIIVPILSGCNDDQCLPATVGAFEHGGDVAKRRAKGRVAPSRLFPIPLSTELQYEFVDGLSTEEGSKAICVARAHIASMGRGDAIYTVRPHEDGYAVVVEFINSYNDRGEPVTVTDNFCVLWISKDLRCVDER